MLEQGGSLRISEPDSASHDYRFHIKALVDFGVDTRKEADRIILIRGYLQETCKDVRIVEEQFLPAGGTALGVRLGTYISKVKCLT